MSVYLDHNATTPVDPRVLEQMLPYFTEHFGNAASIDHDAGNTAREAVEAARAAVAALIGAEPDEIVFTSGATEANNVAILGRMERAGPDATLVVSAIEHPSVLETARHFGERATVVPVGADGVVDPSVVADALTPATALVSVMAANNETGAIQPIAEIGAICAEAGVPFHVDAVQIAGRLPVDVDAAGVALLSISAHKMYGPKGVGALFARRRHPRARVRPVAWGGGHERGLRPGTINVPGVVGLGATARLARADRDSDAARQRAQRDRLAGLLADQLDGVTLTTTADRLPQTLSLRVDGVEGRALMRLLNGKVALATGSACSTTSVDPSHVLLAQGLTAAQASQTLRISLGRFTTDEDVDAAAAEIVAGARKLQRLARDFAA